MNKTRLKNTAAGLLYIIGGAVNTFAADWNMTSSLSIQVNGGVDGSVIGCKNSLQSCPGIIICPNCQGSPPGSVTVTISNNTNVNAQGVTLTAILPNFSTYVAQTGTCGQGFFDLSAGNSCTASFSTINGSYPQFPGFTTTINVTGINTKPISLPFKYFFNG